MIKKTIVSKGCIPIRLSRIKEESVEYSDSEISQIANDLKDLYVDSLKYDLSSYKGLSRKKKLKTLKQRISNPEKFYEPINDEVPFVQGLQ